MKLLSIFIFSLISIQSCGSQTTNNTHPEIPSGLYTIKALADNKTPPESLTIKFDTITNGVSGFSGCNRFFGSYTIENSAIKFEKMASTRMLCEEMANQIEMEFLQSLEKITYFSFENNTLKLFTDKKVLIEANQKNPISFEYTASARGSYLNVIANNGAISKSKKRGGNPISKVCNDSDWNSLLILLKKINLETLPELKAPSKDFQFDGAAMSRLKVLSDGKVYEAQPFDHGNPPKEIAELVKELLSISENIE